MQTDGWTDLKQYTSNQSFNSGQYEKYFNNYNKGFFFNLLKLAV